MKYRHTQGVGRGQHSFSVFPLHGSDSTPKQFWKTTSCLIMETYFI